MSNEQLGVSEQKTKKWKLFLLFSLLFVIFSLPLSGQNGQIQFDTSASVNWAQRELNATASFNLAQAGLRLPAGRLLAEDSLKENYPRLLLPYLLSLRVDSSSTLGDLLDRGEITLVEINALSINAERIPPSLTNDLTRMTGRYTIPIERISSSLIRHRRITEPIRPLIPVPTANYTGIIIIADEELPIHGRWTSALMEPCLFPRIWDTDMNLIYERTMTENLIMVRYTERENIKRPTPSGLEGELAALVGPNPLRIFAMRVFGVSPTDPVIDRQDALKILSTENNRRLLREGRVVFVVDERMLITEF